MRSDETFTQRGRRAQLVRCALEVVADQGYARASIAKIAEAAGITKTVVLHYFPTKDDLVLAVVADVMGRGAGAMLPEIDRAHGARERLAAYIRSNCRFIDAHRRESVAVLDLLTSFRDSHGRRLDEILAAGSTDEAMARLDPGAILRAGTEAGELREHDSALVGVAVRSAIDGMVWTVARDPGFDVIGYGEELVALTDSLTLPSH